MIGMFIRSSDKHCSGLPSYSVAIKFISLFLLVKLQFLKESWQMASGRICLGKEDVMTLNFNDITEI